VRARLCPSGASLPDSKSSASCGAWSVGYADRGTQSSNTPPSAIAACSASPRAPNLVRLRGSPTYELLARASTTNASRMGRAWTLAGLMRSRTLCASRSWRRSAVASRARSTSPPARRAARRRLLPRPRASRRRAARADQDRADPRRARAQPPRDTRRGAAAARVRRPRQDGGKEGSARMRCEHRPGVRAAGRSMKRSARCASTHTTGCARSSIASGRSSAGRCRTALVLPGEISSAPPDGDAQRPSVEWHRLSSRAPMRSDADVMSVSRLLWRSRSGLRRSPR
jgi:hypothetical protein